MGRSRGRLAMQGLVFVGAFGVTIACVGTDPQLVSGSSSGDAMADAPVDASLGPYPGDPGSVSEVGKTGGRLVARYDTANGVRRFAGMYDPDLQSTCEFMPAPDGQLYCFPAPTNLLLPDVFSDADCKEPALQLPSCEAPTRYLLGQDLDACPVIARLYERGEATSLYSAVGGCHPLNETGYKRGAPVPTEKLVKGDLTAIANDGGTGVIPFKVVGADGSESFYALRDEKNVDCVVSRRAGGLRCLPALHPYRVGFKAHFTPTCDGPTEDFASGPLCSGVEYAKSLPEPSCAADDKFYKLLEPTSIYTPDGKCTKIGLTTSFRIEQKPADLAIFPSAVELPLLPNVRLQPRRFELPNGTHGELTGSYYDTELAVECHFLLAEDGTTRCLPVLAHMGTDLYDDAECTSPLELAEWEARCFVEAPTFASDVPVAADAGCSSAPNKVYRLGPLRTGAVFTKASGECKKAPDAPRAPLGDAMSPDRFVPLSLATP